MGNSLAYSQTYDSLIQDVQNLITLHPSTVDEFVHDIRGEIVHRGATPGPLHKDGVKSWINFFDGLVSRLDKKIGTHIETETGTTSW